MSDGTALHFSSRGKRQVGLSSTVAHPHILNKCVKYIMTFFIVSLIFFQNNDKIF